MSPLIRTTEKPCHCSLMLKQTSVAKMLNLLPDLLHILGNWRD